MIESDSGRLIRVVNELLEWGRLQSGHIQLQRAPLNLQALVDEVFMLLRPAAERKAWRWRRSVAKPRSMRTPTS
jgi:signal transduction histidine kinase